MLLLTLKRQDFVKKNLLLENCAKYCLDPEREREPEPKLFPCRDWNATNLYGSTALQKCLCGRPGFKSRLCSPCRGLSRCSEEAVADVYECEHCEDPYSLITDPDADFLLNPDPSLGLMTWSWSTDPIESGSGTLFDWISVSLSCLERHFVIEQSNLIMLILYLF
jgi:hypothetical protein